MQPAFDQKTNLDPQKSNDNDTLSGTTAVNGESVDCDNYGGPIYATFVVGSASGSPSAQSHACKLQESDDGSTGWADISTQDSATITADKGAAIVRAHRTKRYVRGVCTPSFTDGSSPSNTVDSVVMGQLQNTEN